MSRPSPSRLYISFLLAIIPGFASGGDTASPLTISAEEALRLAAEQNPGLRSALLAEERADAQITTEEGIYPFVFQADGGYTHSSTPSAVAAGGVSHTRRDMVDLGASISKTFAVGTVTSFRLAGNRQVSQGTVNGVEMVGDPAYGLTATLSVSQPLLRNFGNRVGRSGLRQARDEKTLARHTAERTASDLALSVLSTYWELWYAALAVEIDDRAKGVAEAQLRETRDRVAVGDAAPVDVLAYQTRVATLEEVLLAAESDRRRLGVSLAQALGIVRRTTEIYPKTDEPLPRSEDELRLEGITHRALEMSPVIREAEASVALAEERASVAGEQGRQRLDLAGWFEARTLGNDELSPLFTQYGDGAAYSGYVGLQYELPLDDRSKEGERAAARVSVQIAKEQLRNAEHQVLADAARAVEGATTARKRLLLAEVTYDVAKQQAEAERERFRLGAATFVEVRDAEEAVREAELRVTRARVDRVIAELTLQHLTGTLLGRVAAQ